MAKKKYSVSARADYHRSRMVSSTASENQRYYSRSWIDGYTDSHARENFGAVCSEIAARKGCLTRSERIGLYGFRNGLQAQLGGMRRKR